MGEFTKYVIVDKTDTPVDGGELESWMSFVIFDSLYEAEDTLVYLLEEYPSYCRMGLRIEDYDIGKHGVPVDTHLEDCP